GARCRHPFRRTSFRWPGWSSLRIPSHGVGVGAAGPIVPTTQADVDEAQALVQRDRGYVVSAHLKENHSTRGVFEQLRHHAPTDALALVRRVHPDGVNLVLVRGFSAEPGDAGVADELV